MSKTILLAKRMLRRTGCAFLMILLLIGVAACSSGTKVPTPFATVKSRPPSTPAKAPPLENWEYRWLQGAPCQPPCWEGITPGETTAEEAATVLSSSPIVASVEIADIPLYPESGMVRWTYLEGDREGRATFDSRASSNPIYVIHPALPEWFRFGDVIQAYGEPSHVIARLIHGPDIGSGIFYDLSIVYLSQGFILYCEGGSKPVLSADTHILGVTFFVPGDKGLEAASGGTDPYLTRITPWQGMKDFDFYCRDEAGKPCSPDSASK